MARRKMTSEHKEFIDGLLAHYQPEVANDVQEMLKDLLGDILFVRLCKKIYVFARFCAKIRMLL